MDPELLDYLSGGFFAGTLAAIAAPLLGSPAGARQGSHDEVVGLWLHPEDAEQLLEEERPIAPARRPPVQQLLQRGMTLREFMQEDAKRHGFRHLGFQVLGFEGDRAWTWAEAGLIDTVAVEIMVPCDGHGLIPERDGALSAAHHLNREDLGPPVIWRPWLLSAHLPRGG